ncbi:MAG: YodC family protein [Cyanobium sp.]|jgi:uncharacterized protein YodC (DUF2158 family)
MAEFKVGDVVQLKSGGPMMTITSIEANHGLLSTTWFDGTRQEKESFPLDAVLHAQNQRPNPRQGRAFFQKPQ